MSAAKKKRRISKEESATLAPLVKDLNKLAKDFVGVFKNRNEEKEKRVSVLISQIKSPKKGKGGVDVTKCLSSLAHLHPDANWTEAARRGSRPESWDPSCEAQGSRRLETSTLGTA